MVKTRSTLIMDADLWKRFKMIAILNEMEVSELVEQALREKLERMKQLEQYPEYKDVRNLRVHKGEQPQYDDTIIHSSRYEAAKSVAQATSAQQSQELGEKPPSSLSDRWAEMNEELRELSKTAAEYMNPDVKLHIPGLEFPTNKEKIIRVARRKGSNTPPVIRALDEIPDKTYQSTEDLLRSFKKAYHQLIRDVATEIKGKMGPTPKISKAQAEELRRSFQQQEEIQQQEEKINIVA